MLQLLGTSSPRLPTGASPLDPTGGLLSPRPPNLGPQPKISSAALVFDSPYTYKHCGCIEAFIQSHPRRVWQYLSEKMFIDSNILYLYRSSYSLWNKQRQSHAVIFTTKPTTTMKRYRKTQINLRQKLPIPA